MKGERESDKWDDNKIIISIYHEWIINIDFFVWKENPSKELPTSSKKIIFNQKILTGYFPIYAVFANRERELFSQNILRHVTRTIKTTW